LVTKSTMPAARHSSRSDWRALAVMATMGTLVFVELADLLRR
jgi:hypothetical protein